MRVLISLMGLLALCSCSERTVPRTSSENPATRSSHSAIAPPPPSPPAPARTSETAVGLALPTRFTALGTEPFWAAKVNGDKLTYSTPEEQVGRTISVTRSMRGELVDLAGTLAGKDLTLTLSAGPCSDGMSDTVYPFTVRRRFGADEQRGCARPTPEQR
jgi:uncharacterized membrane protein